MIRNEGEDRALAGNRYQLQRVLGRGGMAVVHEAFDTVRGECVALKRMRRHDDPEKHARNAQLFEREFHTLAQLAHPRVVAVRDFGLDADGAYYAMELLDGGDLQAAAPLPWQKVCAIAHDLCSALSLLHSRGLLHRDVSPRNVRLTSHGLAKLIDFSAVCPVGTSELRVGTPPCCAPEVLTRQPLDGRTDLYGLGALLYYLLVGQHAVHARSFESLPDAWSDGFAAPSELVPDIPAALDALIVDLLRFDPDARPASASDVIARLRAIGGRAGHS